ncbi:MAG TPA: alpha/beta hydrolase [Alphaproteobacteria bacterium]|nr:alpha/beta hydrolase [Alphaproteobacteria bacterium]
MRDGTRLRVACWRPAGPPRGTCLVLPGRSEFLEKYEHTVADLLRRGLVVCSLDWRGQGLSDRVLPDRMKGHIDRYETWLDDADAVMAQWVAPRAVGPLLLLAHSMGGHIGLRWLAERRPAFDAAVFSAPMVDIHVPLNRTLARGVVRLLTLAGRGRHYTLGHGPRDPHRFNFETNPITTDQANWLRLQSLLNERPELAIGGVTNGWVDATFRSIDRLWRVAGDIALPSLVLSAPDDFFVRDDRHAELAALMGDARLKRYPGAKHEVLNERPDIRRAVWADIDAFLAEVGFFAEGAEAAAG